MKNILSSNARKRAKQEIRKVFKDCRFKDALTMKELDKNTPDDFVYYYNKSRDGEVGNYIIYEIISSDAIHRADNVVIGREVFLQVDIFSLKSFESKLLQETISKLEEKFVAAGFEVESMEEAFEPETKLYHQIFFVSKLYF